MGGQLVALFHARWKRFQPEPASRARVSSGHPPVLESFMSQSAVNVELALRLKDGATAGLKSVTQAAVQSSEKTSAAAVAAATKSSKAAEESASRMSSVAVAAANKFVMSQKDMTAAAIAARKRIEQAQTESTKRQAEAEKTVYVEYGGEANFGRAL
jgi:FKBP-type peptidyl-prolyl cis-trans isomerase